MSTVFAAIDAVVSKLRAAGLTVWDGPVVTGDYSDAVFVGFDADPNSNFEAATLDQQWEGLGARKRSERYDVHCAVVVSYGDGDSWSAARARAQTIVSSVESALRTDPSLGQPPPFVAAFRPLGLWQEPDPDAGFQVRFAFTVSVELARV